jgi:hypothetical protein
MVKKLITGLAISVGAGLAYTVNNQGKKKEKPAWRPANADGEMKPVTVRVQTAVPRNEPQPRTELDEPRALTTATTAPVVTRAATASPADSAELAEIRVMMDALENRTSELMSSVNQRIDELQGHLPRFIDVKVSSRIREVEERLRTEFQDEQSRTLDAFLQTLDQKVLPRISLVEEAVGSQGEEIGKIRQRIEKTDETLGRVLGRIEKVVDSISVPAGQGYNNSHVMEIKKAVA